jgi:parallel beta-helix repeat protein
VANASDVTIWGNQVLSNNKSLNIAGMTCPGLPAFETNEDDDCGEGIHLIAVDHSTVAQNDVELNSGGILITDETGPTFENLITGNTVRNNPFDCGITLASHPPAPSTGAALPFGIYNNTISQNQSTGNGTQVPGAGAGIGIFAPFPGTRNSGNVIIGNTLTYNGLPGVTMHNHAASPMAPPVNMNDNVVVGNTIIRNGSDTEDAATSGPTGINIFSVAPVTGTVISQNQVGQEALDFVFNAPGSVNVHLNNFTDAIGIENLGSGTINATQNWWNCVAGPNTFGCATVVGPGIVFSPVLTRPF